MFLEAKYEDKKAIFSLFAQLWEKAHFSDVIVEQLLENDKKDCYD